MEWWEAGLLGLLQGVTEFFPISSSGHLVLAQEMLGIKAHDDLMFEVFVHLGTAFSVATLYARRLLDMTWQMFRALRRPFQGGRHNPEARTGFFIILTMVPTGLVYILLREPLEAAFGNPVLVCVMLLVTGTLLLLTITRKQPAGTLSSRKALVIGLAQSAAFLPGISRSGATICTALYQDVTPRVAADFAFLMSVPVIFGASMIKGLGLLQTATVTAMVPLIIGTGMAYISGIAAMKVILSVVRAGRLHYFAYYCFGIGILGLILL